MKFHFFNRHFATKSYSLSVFEKVQILKKVTLAKKLCFGQEKIKNRKITKNFAQVTFFGQVTHFEGLKISGFFKKPFCGKVMGPSDVTLTSQVSLSDEYLKTPLSGLMGRYSMNEK